MTYIQAAAALVNHLWPRLIEAELISTLAQGVADGARLPHAIMLADTLWEETGRKIWRVEK